MVATVYTSGADVALTVPTSGTVTSVAVTVLDQDGETITTITPVNPSLGANAEFTVAGIHNTLAEGVVRAAREVRTVVTSSTGVVTTTAYYVIESATPLAVLSNSFMTYPDALVVRAEFPRLSGFDSATKSNQIAALQLAFGSLATMRFKYRIGLEGQNRVVGFPGTDDDGYGRLHVYVPDIREITLDEWQEFPADFRAALKRAQLVEADNLLRGDPVGDKRRAGVISERIGESAMFFRQVPEIQLGVCREALSHLRGYLAHSNRIARA